SGKTRLGGRCYTCFPLPVATEDRFPEGTSLDDQPGCNAERGRKVHLVAVRSPHDQASRWIVTERDQGAGTVKKRLRRCQQVSAVGIGIESATALDLGYGHDNVAHLAAPYLLAR